MVGENPEGTGCWSLPPLRLWELAAGSGWAGVSKRQLGLLSGGGKEILTPPTGIKPLNSGLLQLNTHLFLTVKCSGHGLEFSKYTINIIKTTI